MAQIRLENLRKEYGREEIVAVDDLSLDIEDGEFVTVVGPSGCGKTTTLRMIAGLEQPTDGSVYIGDEDVTDVHAKNRDIAMVFQNYALYPHKTVYENMAFGLRMSTDLSESERRTRVEETAEMMDIDHLLEDTPDELSGGQKQRVALGRAIVREPDAFLFDEPLSNLDAKLRTSMRTEIQRIQNELDVTSVYVTHDQEEAMTMGDRIVILNNGELQQVGEPTEVYDNPVNEFVAGFIGSPSMNFFDVDVTTRGDRIVLGDPDSGFEFELSSEYVTDHADELEANQYTLGIRPENVNVVESAAEGVVKGTVEVVEPIGSDNYLYMDLAEDFIARVDSSIEPDVGERVALTFDESDIHLFEPETGIDVFATERDRTVVAA
ncbi:ABC transporter ATP-binding protein [Halopiger xanaduensis]|uniref:ABC-type D-xylose/L-arabinose transporter n=1 Tax=Halopiger xanaduensis (strain DSM 18323 / JCM 14033 / SH-6) TaxID=797210 RepID=F8D4W9_HALXS|nr:ABC transporter ATP-binding protein [Halopiger xanaduensis]AEH38730.1 Glycerol-3-phosphate-transporting ATPase [Halopiger xanaduensis SH-6]